MSKVTLTEGHTGKTAKDVKTRPTEVDPRDFIGSLPWPRRVTQGLELLELFNEVTGEQAVMWGPTMIGYGQVHYRSSSGREGDWFKLGFSPRSANLTLYGMQAAPDFEELCSQLGPHKLGASCLYITNLDRVDRAVLRQLVEQAWVAPLDGSESGSC